MSTEQTKITLVKPNIFPECMNCQIAREMIGRYLITDIPENYVSVTLKKVEVTCFVDGSLVSMSPHKTYSIQYVKDGPKLKVEGQERTKPLVNCPHFTKS
jgi:hypothetical protein